MAYRCYCFIGRVYALLRVKSSCLVFAKFLGAAVVCCRVFCKGFIESNRDWVVPNIGVMRWFELAPHEKVGVFFVTAVSRSEQERKPESYVKRGPSL